MKPLCKEVARKACGSIFVPAGRFEEELRNSAGKAYVQCGKLTKLVK